MASKIVAVFGATGNQGRGVVDALLEKGGYTPRCLVRNLESDKAKELVKLGCEVVLADFDDVEAMTKALEGVHAVSLMTTQTSLSAQGCVDETRQGLKAVEALKAAKVPFVVYSSVGSADQKTGIPHFESKAKVEAAITEAGIPAFFLRPVCFFQNLDNAALQTAIKQGTLPFLLQPDSALHWVDSDDIGAVAAIAISDPNRFKGKTLELAGEKITGNQMAAVLSELRGGESWRYVVGAPLWLLHWVAPELATMIEWFQTGPGYKDEIEECRHIYPKLHSFRDYCIKKGLDKKQFPSEGCCTVM